MFVILFVFSVSVLSYFLALYSFKVGDLVFLGADSLQEANIGFNSVLSKWGTEDGRKELEFLSNDYKRRSDYYIKLRDSWFGLTANSQDSNIN